MGNRSETIEGIQELQEKGEDAMPWKGATAMSERGEFVKEARKPGANISALCRAYGISRKTGYKWLRRYEAGGRTGLTDRSRCPHQQPGRTSKTVEQAIITARTVHPAWGPRKLKRWLEGLGWQDLPASSTISAILRRYACIDPRESANRGPMTRFEMAGPNQLWQMDFKGRFSLTSGRQCHPLTVLDDHSRFLIGLYACPNETAALVQERVTALFRTYGLPDRMLMDNGTPWGDDADTRHTRFTVWLLRLGIRISHGRPYHPQTQGKVERLHRSLKAEALRHQRFASLDECQTAFDAWRGLYNLERPHEALDLDPPVTRYQPSQRLFPNLLPELRFPSGAAIRKVDAAGKFSLHGRSLRIGRAFHGQHIGLLADDLDDGVFHAFFNAYLIRSFDLRSS
jgi:transposase InsO family protein